MLHMKCQIWMKCTKEISVGSVGFHDRCQSNASFHIDIAIKILFFSHRYFSQYFLFASFWNSRPEGSANFYTKKSINGQCDVCLAISQCWKIEIIAEQAQNHCDVLKFLSKFELWITWNKQTLDTTTTTKRKKSAKNGCHWFIQQNWYEFQMVVVQNVAKSFDVWISNSWLQFFSLLT